MRLFTGIAAVAVTAGALAAFSATSASAATVSSCGAYNPNVSSRVTGTGNVALDCAFVTGLGNASEATFISEVEAAGGIFGYTDFYDVGRFNFGPDGDDADPAITGTALSGGFSFDDATYLNYFIVFKGGNGNNTAPSDVIAYDLGASIKSGLFNSPFIKTNGGQQCTTDANDGFAGCSFREVSNITIYGTGEPPQTEVIPVPAALPLLAGALGILGLIRRRASRA